MVIIHNTLPAHYNTIPMVTFVDPLVPVTFIVVETTLVLLRYIVVLLLRHILIVLKDLPLVGVGFHLLRSTLLALVTGDSILRVGFTLGYQIPPVVKVDLVLRWFLKARILVNHLDNLHIALILLHLPTHTFSIHIPTTPPLQNIPPTSPHAHFIPPLPFLLQYIILPSTPLPIEAMVIVPLPAAVILLIALNEQ